MSGPTEAKTVELVGGPKDGEIVAVPGDERWCHVAVFWGYDGWFDESKNIATYKLGRYAPITEADSLLGRWTWREPT